MRSSRGGRTESGGSEVKIATKKQHSFTVFSWTLSELKKEVQEGGSDFKHSEMDTKGHGRVAFHLWEVPKAQQRAKQIYELPLKRPNG